MHGEDSATGIWLNNLHGTVVRGKLPLNLMGEKTVLSKSDFSGTQLRQAHLRASVGAKAIFCDADLSRTDLTDSVFPGADFRGANLQGVSFVNAVLNGSDFSNATVTGADFTGAYLLDAKGIRTDQHTTFIAARIVVPKPEQSGNPIQTVLINRFGNTGIGGTDNEITAVPVSVDDVIDGRLFASKRLAGLYALRLSAAGTDFTKAELIGSIFEELSAPASTFRAARLSGATIVQSTLREADLAHAWMPGAIIEDVDLSGANLEKANMCGAVLSGVNLRNAVGIPSANVEGIIIGDGCILPQGVGYDGIKLQLSRKLTNELNS